MNPLTRIIVGHDLRSGGEIALQSAAVLASRCAAVLRLVHVVEPLDAYQRLSHPLTSPYSVDEIAEKSGARLKNIISDAALVPIEAEYEVRVGKPFIELITAQRAWLANLIVVGPTAEPEEPFFGSTAERIVRKAPAPVMVAKKRLRADSKTFLVPTDFSACSRNAAEQALTLAESFNAHVTFLHIIDPHPGYAVPYVRELGASAPAPAPSREALEPEWQAFLTGLRLERIQWEKRTEGGRAAAAIIREAQHTSADMILIGTHGRSGLPHMLLGSVAERVIRSAPCPVLTIRPDSFQFQMP